MKSIKENVKTAGGDFAIGFYWWWLTQRNYRQLSTAVPTLQRFALSVVKPILAKDGVGCGYVTELALTLLIQCPTTIADKCQSDVNLSQS